MLKHPWNSISKSAQAKPSLADQNVILVFVIGGINGLEVSYVLHVSPFIKEARTLLSQLISSVDVLPLGQRSSGGCHREWKAGHGAAARRDSSTHPKGHA